MSKVEQIRDWYRVRPGYWFRPKYLGYGATPVTWQGWLATLAIMAICVPIALYAGRHNLAYLALLAPVLFGFILLCRAKTDGDWRWRSGGE